MHVDAHGVPGLRQCLILKALASVGRSAGHWENDIGIKAEQAKL